MPDSALVEFLRKAKDTLKVISSSEFEKNVHIVLGNESCDLDSVVCALCLSLLLHHEGKEHILPVLNIPKEEFALRTEVTYLLRGNNVPADLLIFRDDVDLAALHSANRLRLVLVDHHALPEVDRPLAAALVGVLDHRPPDAEAVRAFPDGCDVDMRIVGSCASLVGERILARAAHLLDHQLAVLIRGTILLDSACFSPEADRTTPLDVSVVEACERSAGMTEASRGDTFDRIVSARKDVSSLSAFQILHKDMKFVRGLPLPGMPILVRDFLGRSDARPALSAFCAKHGADAAVVMGMSFEGEAPATLKRDLAVYSAGAAEQPAQMLVAALLAERTLQLHVLRQDEEGITLFEQRNSKASRKQVLPVVQRVLSQAHRPECAKSS